MSTKSSIFSRVGKAAAEVAAAVTPTPSLTQASEQLSVAQAAMVAAQAHLTVTELALDNLHASGAEDAQIIAAEADVASADMSRDRAARRLAAAEARHTLAKAATKATEDREAADSLAQHTATRDKAAEQIEQAYALIKSAMAAAAEADKAIAILSSRRQVSKHALLYIGVARWNRLVELEAKRSGVLPGATHGVPAITTTVRSENSALGDRS